MTVCLSSDSSLTLLHLKDTVRKSCKFRLLLQLCLISNNIKDTLQLLGGECLSKVEKSWHSSKWKFLRETHSNFDRNLILKHLCLSLERLRNIFDVLEWRQACLQKYLSILTPELILQNDWPLWSCLLCNLLASLTCMLKICELYLIHKLSCNSLVQLCVCYLESLKLLITSFLFLCDSL